MNHDIVTTNGGNGHGTPASMTITEALTLAEHFARSGYFADAKQASQAVVKIIAGRELGIGPMAAMSGIHLVQGKPALSAGLIGALIARSGRYRYEVLRCDGEGCELEWYRDGQAVGRSSFTIEEARRAGLATKDIWQKYPSDLCFARALTRGARRFCPDVSMGPAYTPEELGGGLVPDITIDPTTGEVIDAPARTLPEAPVRPAEPRTAPPASQPTGNGNGGQARHEAPPAVDKSAPAYWERQYERCQEVRHVELVDEAIVAACPDCAMHPLVEDARLRAMERITDAELAVVDATEALDRPPDGDDDHPAAVPVDDGPPIAGLDDAPDGDDDLPSDAELAADDLLARIRKARTEQALVELRPDVAQLPEAVRAPVMAAWAARWNDVTTKAQRRRGGVS